MKRVDWWGDYHLTYVAMTRQREDLYLYFGCRSFEMSGGLTKILSRQNAKETTLDYERGTLYRDALHFAENRGLPIVHVERTLLRDRLDWTLRQKKKLTDLANRLRALGEWLGLPQSPLAQSAKESEPMVAGVTRFENSVADTVSERLDADPALKKQWEEVSIRFRYVFADPETAFRAMNFDAVLADKDMARQLLQKPKTEPASIGPVKDKTGILASKTERDPRRVAEVNVLALKRDLERYLQMRESVTCASALPARAAACWRRSRASPSASAGKNSASSGRAVRARACPAGR